MARHVQDLSESKALTSSERPKEIEGVGIKEKLGQKVDLSVQGTDENGQKVLLSSFFDGRRPVILSPVYYSCPSLCNYHLNGLTEVLGQVDWTAGDKFQVVAFSFDARDTVENAKNKKESYMKIYNRPGSESGWHFLTMDEATIQNLTQMLGFSFKWNEESQEWSHASSAIILTPDGKISRYLPGISFESQDVKLALNEATEGRIGNFVESLVLYCFQYNAHMGRYSLAAIQVMKLGGAIMVLLLSLWLLPIWIRTRREQKT